MREEAVYPLLVRLLGSRLAAPVMVLWYLTLIVAIVYFAGMDQAPFRYGQL